MQTAGLIAVMCLWASIGLACFNHNGLMAMILAVIGVVVTEKLL